MMSSVPLAFWKALGSSFPMACHKHKSAQGTWSNARSKLVKQSKQSKQSEQSKQSKQKKKPQPNQGRRQDRQTRRRGWCRARLRKVGVSTAQPGPFGYTNPTTGSELGVGPLAFSSIILALPAVLLVEYMDVLAKP